MDTNGIKVSIIIEISKKWADNLTEAELVKFIRAKIDGALGFRGEVKKVKLVKRLSRMDA